MDENKKQTLFAIIPTASTLKESATVPMALLLIQHCYRS